MRTTSPPAGAPLTRRRGGGAGRLTKHRDLTCPQVRGDFTPPARPARRASLSTAPQGRECAPEARYPECVLPRHTPPRERLRGKPCQDRGDSRRCGRWGGGQAPSSPSGLGERPVPGRTCPARPTSRSATLPPERPVRRTTEITVHPMIWGTPRRPHEDPGPSTGNRVARDQPQFRRHVHAWAQN